MYLRRIVVVVLLSHCVWQLLSVSIVSGNAVFRVQHKFRGREKPLSLSELKAHDDRRHGRMLSAIDLPLGGDSNPGDTGLYFTKIRIGIPSKDHHVQVDTGSDILWVSCAGCDKCPTKSDLGIELTLYDPKGSSSAKMVGCGASECSMIHSSTISGCKPDMPCNYQVTYGDGSSSAGYIVQDYVHYDRVSENFQTTMVNGSVVFGCGAKLDGQLSSSSNALDGIMGFGQKNSSMLSQLAAAGKVKKAFSHCLDGEKGGGIFAIGEVVQPKLNTTPLIAEMNHYNVVMKSIEVAGNVIKSFGYFSSHKAAIIDSGTTLAYLPGAIYEQVMLAILSKQPGLQLETVKEQFRCFQYNKNVDDGFPTVKFHFENSLTLTVYPHEYLFEIHDEMWCVGWQNSALQSKGGNEVTLLGDMVLSNKLVFYDLVNQGIGWTEYNCSSSIKVKDNGSGAEYTVGAKDISSAGSLILAISSTFSLGLFATLFIILHWI
ncbi:hypothetical protein Ancab_024508 [Ancistrocladus abbreviatus]